MKARWIAAYAMIAMVSLAVMSAGEPAATTQAQTDPASAELSAQAASLLAEAAKAAGEDAADALVDKALAIQDRIIELERTSSSYKGQVRCFRAELARAVTEGLTKVDPYAQKMQYLLAGPGDRLKVLCFTEGGIARLDELHRQLTQTYEQWNRDDESKITGAFFGVEELNNELRFRRGWMLVYRVMALPADSPQRPGLLARAIKDVADFAEAPDDASGARLPSLLLTGIALREQGKADAARKSLLRILAADSPPEMRLRTMFEIARTCVDEGNVEATQSAIADFRAGAAKVEGIQPVAIDLPSALLESRLWAVLAESARLHKSAQAREYADRSAQTLLAIAQKYPDHLPALMGVLGPAIEGRDTDSLPEAVLVALASWQASKNTPKGMQEAQTLYQAVLKRTPPAGQGAAMPAMRELARLALADGRTAEGCRWLSELARTYPDADGSKAAAIEAVRCMDRLINNPQAKPADGDLAAYVQSLETLLGRWGGDADVRPWNYALAMQYQRLGRIPQAIAAYENVDPADEVCLPAWYRGLTLRADAMIDAPARPDAAPGKSADELLERMKQYHTLAAQYTSNDPARLASARAMGADIDLLAVRVVLDVQHSPAQARKLAERIADDWPGVPDIADRSQALRIRAFVAEGDIDHAVEALAGVNKGADALATELVSALRQKIERLDPAADATAMRNYVDIYIRLAERIHRSALARFERQAANWPPGWTTEQMYPFVQVLAGAYEYSDDRARLEKALGMYRSLGRQKKDDAVNLRGIARCCRKLGAGIEAMNSYNRLVAGLAKQSPAWWQAQLERLQYAWEISAGDAEELKKISLQLHLLAEQDPDLGGPVYQEKFRRLQAAVNEARARIAPVAGGLVSTRPAK